MKQLEALGWYVRCWVRAMGLPCGLAAAVIVVAIGGYYGGVVPLREELAQLNTGLVSLRSQQANRANVPAQKTSAQQLASFYLFFPTQAHMPDVLGKIYAAAPPFNLQLEQGEYRLLPTKSETLMRYEIVLPVKGGYLQIRQFMAEILQENPSLALQGVTFTRDTVSRTGVDAQLRLTLYLRAG